MLPGGEAHFDFDLRPRKPDRVHGLQQTQYFTKNIQAIVVAIEARAMEDVGLDESLKAFQFTPFEERSRPLIFPFLISEAKTERGDSFEACERQTAFPIFALLRLQERLETASQQRLEEQGGSFVWFFANRGEDWRLYACFTEIEEESGDQSTFICKILSKFQLELLLETSNKPNQVIQDLWAGRLDTQDGVLQVLLLVDYIFDWARDIYRHSIARLLQVVLDKTSGESCE
jgi:hypothetical protein